MKRTLAMIAIFAVPMILGIYQYIESQARTAEALKQANIKFAQIDRDNQIKYQEFQDKLAELYAIPEDQRTSHDKWYIGHMEKMSRHMERVMDRPEHQQVAFWHNRSFLENSIMMLLLASTAIIYVVQQHKTRRQYPAEKGLSSSPWIFPQHDPLAEQVAWQPMRSGGANFKTHALIESPDKIKLKPSIQMGLFFGAFILVGANNVLFNYLEVIYEHGVAIFMQQPSLIFKQWATVGTTFIALGLALRVIFVASPVVFDRIKGYAYFDDGNLLLTDVHALQVIEEIAGGHGSGVFKSYELNLILRNGERIHLMDHGDEAAFKAQARRLSEFLQLPVWKA